MGAFHDGKGVEIPSVEPELPRDTRWVDTADYLGLGWNLEKVKMPWEKDDE